MQSSFSVTGIAHPFGARPIHFDMAGGASLEDVLLELIKRSEVSPAVLRGAAVYVGDVPVPAEYWSQVRVKANTAVMVRAVPGDDVLSTVIQIAGIAAAFYVPGALGLSGFAAKLLGAAIGVGSSLIAQAVAPGPQIGYSGNGQNEPPNPTYSIAGVRNEARPYGVIPKVFGRVVNYHPPLAAVPYTEILSGDRQILRMMFAVGHGPLSISNLRIGTTPIDQFSDLSYQVDEGIGVSGSSLYPREVREESLSSRLSQSDGYIQRTTPIETDEIRLDVSFPSGLIRIGQENKKFTVEVDFQVQYRPAAGGSWLNAPLASSTAVGVILEGGGVFKVRGQTKSARRVSVGFDVTRGQYQVRVRRITQDDQASIPDAPPGSITIEQAFWISLRSYQNERPVTLNDIALITIRARASERLTGVIDGLNCTVQAKLPVYNGASFSTQVTRNPAWAFVEILAGPQNAKALPTSRLDLVAIKAWADRCDANGYSCDAVLSYRTNVWQLLNEIASCGRASPTILDGQYTVVEDTVKTTVVQHFSMRNMRGLEVARTFADLPHALKVRFPDVNTEHQTAELLVYDDNRTAANSTKFEVLDLPYTTDAATAWKFGRFALAAARLRPEILSGEVDIEYLACTRGDLVRISFDVILVGLGSAYVTAVQTSGSDVTGITVELPMPMAVDTTYAIRLRKAVSGATVSTVHLVDTDPGEQTDLVFTTPITTAEPQPAVGDLILFGESGLESSEWIVRSIEPRADLSAAITFVAHAPAIHTADSGPIPPFDPQITLPPMADRILPPAPRVVSVDSDEDALLFSNNGLLQAQIVLGIDLEQSNALTPPELLQVQYRLKNSGNAYTQLPYYPVETTQVVLSPVEEAETYEIRLRTVTATGAASAWVEIEETVIGQSTPPKGINHIFREGKYISWTYPDPPLDFAGYRVRANYGTSTNYSQGRDLHSGVLSESRFDISSLDGTQTLMVVAVDIAGNVSTSPAIVVINLGDPLTTNLLLTQSEDPSFSGTTIGGTVVSNELVADIDGDPMFWGADNALFWGADGATFWPTVTYADMSYVAAYDPISNHLGATVKLAAEVTGDYTLDYRELDSPAFWGADGATFWGADTDLFWAASTVSEWTSWPGILGPLEDDSVDYEFRVTVAAGATRGVISNFDVLVDVPDITETIEDFDVADSGVVRLPITKTYRAIKLVNYTVQNAGGPRTVDQLDKDASSGPSIEVLNATTGARVAETIDATVIGY